MSNLTPEEQTFCSALKVRAMPGHPNPPTLDEMKRYIIILRGVRKAAADLTQASAAKKKAKAAPADTDSLLADFEMGGS
jgi:hypothetical protein